MINGKATGPDDIPESCNLLGWRGAETLAVLFKKIVDAGEVPPDDQRYGTYLRRRRIRLLELLANTTSLLRHTNFRADLRRASLKERRSDAEAFL
jgi:hypothetical protein